MLLNTELNTYLHLSCAVRLSEGLLCPLAPPTRGRKLRAVGVQVVAIGRASVGWGRPGAGTWLMGAVMQHKYPACSLDQLRHLRAANAQFKTTHAEQNIPRMLLREGNHAPLNSDGWKGPRGG